MAAYGDTQVGVATGDVTTLDTASIVVSGSDLALVAGACESVSGSPTFTLVWDPVTNNESMTGTFATVSAGTYADATLQYLDDPTAATGVVRATWTPAAAEAFVTGTFFTDAGDIVGTDTANDSYTTSDTSLSATAPNVVSGDMVIAQAQIGQQNAMSTSETNQTSRASAIDSGGYLRGDVSTRPGADGGTMGYTFSSSNYGGILIAARIPDAGGGPAPTTNHLTLLGVG